MREDKGARRFMLLFEDVGRLYVAELLTPSWDRFGQRMTAPKALQLFCGSYAYERAGASPDYAPAARQAIADAGHRLDPALVWAAFRKRIDRPVNPGLNPLHHRRRRGCDCLICVLDDGSGPRNVVVRARKAIADDQIEDVHNELRQVRGVGRKIASFFLRDVALRFGLAPDTNRWLLQPVDLWIRRFTALLDADRGTSDRAVAEWVVTHSEVPELANAGLWYFGARIARRRLEWEEALGDPAVAEALVRRRVAGMEAAAAAWKARRGD